MSIEGQVSRIQVLNEVVSRMKLAANLGIEYQGARDIYLALGYPKNPTYAEIYARYKRQDIANAIINKPVNASWNGGFYLSESINNKTDSEQTTAFEKAADAVIKDQDLHIFNNLIALDKLTGIGRYGVLLFGLGDIKNPMDFRKPVAGSNNKLIYVKSFGEGNAKIDQEVTDMSDKRYGQPLFYRIAFKENELIVHYSRVLHVAGDEALTSEIYGNSRLEPVYNRLIDLEKMVGGSAEMYWRGARPGYAGKTDSSLPEMTPDQEEKLHEQLDEYEHNLRRFIITQGIDIQGLQTQVVSAKDNVDIQIQMISAQTGIPKRILTGSELGQLASTEDKDSWNTLISTRRYNFLEQSIIRPFVAKLTEFGILPAAEYSVMWNQAIFEQSLNEKATIGETRARALASYASQPTAESIIPPATFYKYFLGLSKDEVEDIKMAQDEAMQAEGG